MEEVKYTIFVGANLVFAPTLYVCAQIVFIGDDEGEEGKILKLAYPDLLGRVSRSCLKTT